MLSEVEKNAYHQYLDRSALQVNHLLIDIRGGVFRSLLYVSRCHTRLPLPLRL